LGYAPQQIDFRSIFSLACVHRARSSDQLERGCGTKLVERVLCCARLLICHAGYCRRQPGQLHFRALLGFFGARSLVSVSLSRTILVGANSSRSPANQPSSSAPDFRQSGGSRRSAGMTYMKRSKHIRLLVPLFLLTWFFGCLLETGDLGSMDA